MPVTEIESLEQFNQIIHSGVPVIIDFAAEWCGPCKVISPVLERHSDNAVYAGVKFYKVDVDAVPDVAKEVGIRAMPTFMVFKDGNKLEELVGANPGRLETLVQLGVSLA